VESESTLARCRVLDSTWLGVAEAMKRKRLLIAGAAVMLLSCGYFLLTGPPERLKLPSGPRLPMISLGDSHGLVLASDGSMWSWGGQDRGWPVLGLGKTNLTTSLVRISSEKDWAYISAGDDHNLALKSDGTIWAWGANYRGQLGDGTRGGRLTNGLPNLQDRPVHSVPGTDWVKVEAGSVTSYAIKRDGSLWAWGLNNFSQLGIGSWSDSPGAVQVGAATNWAKIRAGGVSAAGIQSDGSLWIWGGSPKLGNTTPQSSENLLVPTRLTSDSNWVDVSVAFNLWLAIKREGTLWAWGSNAHSFTGDPQVEIPIQIGLETNWLSVSSSQSGYYHLLSKRDGTLWIMEAAPGGAGSDKFRKVDLPPNVVAWDTGGGAYAAITQDGEVWTCGTILGQHGPKYRLIQKAEELCWRFGWKVRWQYDRPRIVQEKPRQVHNIGPTD
jgi:alpha-tubulin suppressor-like RCC1 family protein